MFGTSSFFMKIFRIFSLLILLGFFINNFFENITEYLQYTVITQIELVNEFPMTLPAITLCLSSYSTFSTDIDLIGENVMTNCKEGAYKCNLTEIDSFEVKLSFNYWFDIPKNTKCYVFNGGKNSFGNSIDIKTSREKGLFGGYEFNFILPKNHFLIFYVNEANIRPSSFELDNNGALLPGSIHLIKLEKIVETKIEEPFSKCKKPGDFPDSVYIRTLSEANIKYRQENCFDLCHKDFINKSAMKLNSTKRGWEENRNFDFYKNCESSCPLECETTVFSHTETKLPKEILPGFQAEEYLHVHFFFKDFKYNRISQSVKTNEFTLISNLGGSAGLFLELSCISIVKAFDFIFGIIFKI